MKKFKQVKLGAFFMLLTLCANIYGQRQLEIINRGVVAVRTGTNEVFVSWRWLGTEFEDVSFYVYRDDTKLNETPISGSTNYVDYSSTEALYSVAAVVNGIEQPRSAGTEIWAANYKEIDLNRPAGGTVNGSSYTYSPNDCSVGDLDGDGDYEIVVKWYPSNAKDNSQSGYTGNTILDAYEFDGTQLWRIDLGINIRSGAHYTQYMVYDLNGDGKAEVACKTAPGTTDNTGSYLSNGPAATADHTADYRNSGGYILSGPEYLTVFSGDTGNEMVTVNYVPARGSVSSWGDSYGNRVDRFLACVAYLDGEKPSLVMARGYYTRTVLAAWDLDGGELTQRWVFDTNDGYSSYAGQGNHSLSVADVDDDGKDEIIYGAMTVDDDGTGLYNTGLGHGDALHVSDMDPDRPGLELFSPHEEGGNGMTYRDAGTGEILFQLKAPGVDVGRGVAADIDPDHYGYEMWSSTGDGVYNIDGEVIGGKTSMNFLIYWDGDLTRELLDNITISKYNVGTLLTAYGCASNNSTKATPNLSADILGDWREELILRTSDNEKLRIYTTTDVTEHKFITLMHDPQYRLAIAWQNVGYNQPPHLGYFLGEGMPEPPIAPIAQAKLKWTGNSNFDWDINNSQNWKLNDNSPVIYTDGDDVLFSMSGDNSSDINISETLNPSKVTVISPSDYTLSGTGKLSGNMELVKGSKCVLTINTDNDYTGNTIVSEGKLVMNGDLINSKTIVKSRGTLTGEGALSSLEIQNGATLLVGNGSNPGVSAINGTLTIEEGASVFMDLSDDPTGVTNASDIIEIDGDLVINGPLDIEINKINATLVEGMYTLMSFTGSFSGSVDDINLIGVNDNLGINDLMYSLELSGQSIVLITTEPRDATTIIWDGNSNNVWNYLKNENWLNNGVHDLFTYGDHVVFNDAGNSTVVVEEDVPIGGMEFVSSNAYTFSGNGAISGEGGLVKSGSGYLILNDHNTFAGNVEINSGFIEVNKLSNIGTASSIGTGSNDAGSITFNGGKLYCTGDNDITNRKITIGSSGGEIYVEGQTLALNGAITGEGSFTKRGQGTLSLAAVNTLNGAFNVTEGIVQLTTESANSYGFGNNMVIIKDATVQMLNSTGSYSDIYWNIDVPAGYTGTINIDGRCDHYGNLTGGGVLNLNTPFTRPHLLGDWSAFTGLINVTTSNDGWFICGNSLGYPNASLNLGDNVFAVYKNSSDDTVEIGELTGSSSSELGSGGQAINKITWKIGGKNTSVSFDGKITDNQYKNSGASAAIIKTGSGRWTLTNSNTYSGGTVIERGSIIAQNTSGSATGSGDVNVGSRAALSGSGFISGEVTVNNRAYLMPGLTSTIGNLSINNNLNLLSGAIFYTKVNASISASDKVTVSGTTNLAGTLQLVLTEGNFAYGQSFKILDCNNIVGSFDAISPATPGDGLYWDLSYLNTNGIISVTDTPTAIDLKKESDLSTYPNPVENVLFVSLKDSSVSMTLEIRNVNGQLLYIQQDINSEDEIDLSMLSKGVYLLKIYTGQQQWIRKIIKK